jgi:hypothetical protein
MDAPECAARARQPVLHRRPQTVELDHDRNPPAGQERATAGVISVPLVNRFCWTGRRLM